MTSSTSLIEAARELSAQVNRLHFSAPVAHVYNPLIYAWSAHEEYLRRFGDAPKDVIFIGMNPGPYGMAQTGVPFGEINAVRDWMGIEKPIGRPVNEHPRRPIRGFECKRSEVSGKRLWGLFAARFGTPEKFFARHFVFNYCPLALVLPSGKNLTPDKLPQAESAPLFKFCDAHLWAAVENLRPRWIIGIGKFAAQRAHAVVAGTDLNVGIIPHPSPANTAANKDWAGTVTRKLQSLGVWK